MSGKIVILGCGNGAGTPGIGNFWGKCDPREPKNRRTRSSILIQSPKTTILVDTGPDLRQQFNRHDIKDVDAILYTHAHADHVHGIDEFTTLARRNKKKYAAYGDPATLAEIRHRFDYIFDSKEGFYPALIEAYTLELYKNLTIGDIEILPFEQDHGTRTSTGFRVGDVAYSTDMKRLDDKAFDALHGVQTWIVDGAGYQQDDNPVHANLKEVYAYNERIGARRVILTHLAPNMDYQTVTAEVPEGYEVAYDGMEIEF